MEFLIIDKSKITINPYLYDIIRETREELSLLFEKDSDIRINRGMYRYFTLRRVRMHIDYLAKQLRFLKTLVKTCQHISSCYRVNAASASCMVKFNKQVNALFEEIKRDCSRGYTVPYSETLKGILLSSFKDYEKTVYGKTVICIRDAAFNSISIEHFPYWAALIIEEGYGAEVSIVKEFIDENIPEGFRFNGYGNCVMDDSEVLFGQKTISCTVFFVRV